MNPLQVYYGFGHTQFERPNGARYGKMNMFTVPASSIEEARAMITMENGLVVRSIKDKIEAVNIEVKEVPQDQIALAFWSNVVNIQEEFLGDVVKRLIQMGMDRERVLEIVYIATDEGEQDEQ